MDLRHSARAALCLAFLGFVLALAPAAAAQPATIRGTVTEAGTDLPLPGVNVSVPATTVGTTTDADGRYELAIPSGSDRIQFSFVGYRPQTVELAEGATTLNVQLEQDVLGLEELVVSGVATSVRRANASNSVEVISSRELAEITTPQTLGDAISGKVTGAVVSSYTGAPGGGLSIRLRGITTINGSSQPLFIVDGVTYNNDAVSNGINAITAAAAGGNASNQDNPTNRIADLNPDDIESIEILKGPSAAAIYGARASNGVVIITTKRGRAGGGTQFSVNQSIGVATLARRLGTRQFTEATAIDQYTTPPGADATPEELADYEESVERIRGLYQAGAAAGFYDYEDALYGNDGLQRTTSLSAAGGSERTQFYVSGQVKDDEGIISGTGYERQSGRVNVTHRFSGRATLDATTAYTRSVARRGITGNDNTGTSFGVALSATPNFIDLFSDENGAFPNHPFNSSNPLQTRDLSSIGETNNRATTTGRFSYALIQRGDQALQAVVDGGADYYNLQSSLVFPVELQFFQGNDLRGASIQGRTNNLNLSLRGALVHTLGLTARDLFFTTQAGFSVFSQDQNIIRSTATGLIPGQQNIDQASALTSDQFRLSQDDRALFAQEEVNWADRVIGTLGLRAERSSLNGDVDKYYLFPKAGLAVNVAEFPFWSVDALDLVKLRLAYGVTGNTAPFGARYTTFGPLAIDGNVGLNINLTRGFAEVEPERASEIEGGLDLSGFGGRMNLELTAYHKVVDNLILTRQVPFSTGFSFETFNGGELTNNGVEIGLSLIPVTSPNFQWVSRTSWWTYRSEVTRLDVPAFQAVGGGFGNTLGSIRIEEGESPTQIVGIDDTDGDGTSDGVFKLGDAAPDFQMSFTNDFTIMRNLRLTVFAHWKKGGYNINLSELLYDLGGTSPDFDEDDDGDGTVNGRERTGLLGTSARPFVQNASYFKVREVGLYYTVPDRFTRPALGGLRNLRIGVSANNLLTITPYRSYDPEVNNFGDAPVATGVEVTPFPSQRSYFVHIGFGL
jgi:TonB-linked SusC/RagA family outer membrane protein